MMFVYVSVAIGFFPSKVYNRFLLGIAGILVVIMALVISIGINCYLGIKLTMISAEVVPFLILAIGVDNMFLISRAEREVPDHIKPMELRVAFALKEIGPSIFTAAFCESLAFFIGMLTDVPALWSFCLVAGIAVITDFLLQITMFVSVMAMDGRRIQENRWDCCFCIKASERKQPRKEWLRTVFQKSVVPMIFYPATQVVILATGVMLFIIGVCSCIKLDLGLNQNVGFVENSDPYRFFNAQYDYGDAGPPAYLVFKDVDYTN
jgi:Niemann-Pick C1 protein